MKANWSWSIHQSLKHTFIHDHCMTLHLFMIMITLTYCAVLFISLLNLKGAFKQFSYASEFLKFEESCYL